MKTILVFVIAAVLAGCANQSPMAGGKGDCCGLKKAQWKAYDEKAADAVTNPAAWAKLGLRMPKGVRSTQREDLFGTTDSPDGVRPPSTVEIHVPIGWSVPGCSVVMVEFKHPEGKITSMEATDVDY